MYLGSKSGETQTIDLDQNDGETGSTGTGMLGSAVTIPAYRSVGRGARCYEADMSVTKGKGHVQMAAVVWNGGATKVRLECWFEVNNVTTPAYDVPLWRDASAGARYELRYSRLTDGKLHFYDGAGEINSANAFAIPSAGSGAFGSVFGIRITWLVASPFTITVESATSTTSPTTWTAHQSGAGASAPPAAIGSYFFEDLGAGVNHNWKARLQVPVMHDDYNETFTDEICDVVLDGVPISDSGTHNAWHNSAGTTCSVGGANCYAEVDEVPPVSTDYVEYTGTLDARQTWPTSALLVVSTDTVAAVRPACHMTRGSPAGSGGFGMQLEDGGTDIDLAGTPPTAGTTRWAKGESGRSTDAAGSVWTVAKAQAAEVGYLAILLASNPALRINAMYKLIVYKMGSPPSAQRRRGGVV